jgi:hypothetical protein
MSRSPAGAATSSPPAGPPKEGRRGTLRGWLISLPDRRIIGKGISLLAWLWPFLKWFWAIPLAVITGVTVVFLTAPQGSKAGPQSSIGIGLIVSYSGWIIGISAFLIVVSICSTVSVALKNAAAQEAKRREEEAEKQARLAREEAEHQAREQREETERKAKELREAAARRAQREQEEAERERRAWPFVLKPVEQLDPQKEPYIHQYVKDAYVSRDADKEARAVLREAMNRTGGSPLGICIFGRPTLGKTRLAFETMRAELAGWTFVKWSHNKRPEDFDFAAQQGKKLVLWLDDLHEYAGQTEAPTLLDLPRHFEDVAGRLVIVATCRDGEERKRAETALGGLLERLTPVQPMEITTQQADTLTGELEQAGQEVHADEFDGTPGSVVLGVGRMQRRYKDLDEDTQSLLLAMKLLRSARIYDYPVPRVRAVAVEVFHLNEPRWHHALRRAVEQGFLRREALAAGEEGELTPQVDVYLDKAVPALTKDMADFWPELEKSLMRYKDADALNNLGIAFNEHPVGDLRANQQHAEACYRAAQRVYTRQAAPANWATAQNNLGTALGDQARLAEGAEQVRLLGEAVGAFRAALEVSTRQAAPAAWAATQNNLGETLRRQAELAEGGERARLLGEAVAAFQAALKVRTRQAAPAAWAMTQNNLGAALRQQAGLAEKGERARLLGEAVVAYQAALEVSTRQAAPAAWAMTQYNLALLHLYRAAMLEEEGTDAACQALKEAWQSVARSLGVYTREAVPLYHQYAMKARARIEERLRELGCEAGG